jgi:hypothetical protein
MIRKLGTFANFNNLVKECELLISTVPFKNDIKQLAIQVKDPEVEDWYESCGRIHQVGLILKEQDYKHINPALKGSAIEAWINSFEVPIYRTRLMLISGRTAYSVHKDFQPRIHLPVITTAQNYMCFPGSSIMQHLPANGDSYWVDTRIPHTFVNCSAQDRIHLVACTDN